MGNSELKVPGGKLLRAFVESNSNNQIISVKITGDFFLHPEELLPEIETALLNKPLVPKILTATISKILNENDAVLVGAEPQDFATVLCNAANAK